MSYANSASDAPARTLVVIPACNEAENIGGVLQAVNSMGLYDVLVVDDNSLDTTAAVALEHGAVVLPLLIRLGAWGAAQTGIRYGILHGYETIVTMDADGQHHPADIPLLVKTLKDKQVDVAIGSCTVRGSRARHLAWWFFRRLSGLKLEDLTSGLKVFGGTAARHLVKADATIFDYQDLGVMLYLLQNKMRIVECEVSMSPRNDGKSRIFCSWLMVIKYMMQTLLLCISMRSYSHAGSIEGGGQ